MYYEKKFHTPAIIISSVNIAVNLFYTVLGYTNLFCFHRFAVDDSVAMLFIWLTILSAEIIVAVIIDTPHLWMFRYISDALEEIKTKKSCHAFRIIWIFIFLYCMLCFAQSYLQDKQVYEMGQTTIIDHLTWAAFGLLINFEYLTFHIVTLKTKEYDE